MSPSQTWAKAAYAPAAPNTPAARSVAEAAKITATAKAKAVAHWKAKAKAKAKLKGALNGSLAKTESILNNHCDAKWSPSIDVCSCCHKRQEGWSDSCNFYCIACWCDYDATVSTDASADQTWHDDIISADAADTAASLTFRKTYQYVSSAWKNYEKNATLIHAGVVGAGASHHSNESDCTDEEEELDGLAPLPGDRHAEQRDSSLGTLRKATQPSHIVVMVDQSGSMRTLDVEDKKKSENTYTSRISAVLKSLHFFFQSRLQDSKDDVYTLISFNDTAITHFVKKTAPDAAKYVSSAHLVAHRQTEFNCGLVAASDVLTHDQKSVDRKSHLIIFSDGRPGDTTHMLKYVQHLLSSVAGLHIHTIGFGDSLTSFEYLQQLASIGNGTFVPSGMSLSSFRHAFSCVSSTITSITSSSSSFSFKGPDSKERGTLGHSRGDLRVVTYELPNQCAFKGNESVLRVDCTRKWYIFDGSSFECRTYYADNHKYEVAMRTKPYTKGGMRLVYGFQDPTIRHYSRKFTALSEIDEMKDDTRMVLKLSKYEGAFHNSLSVVSSYARSSAAAKFFSRCFDIQLNRALGNAGRSVAKIVFVECWLYNLLSEQAPAPFAIAERYLPGIFLKYNSNKGYVNEEAADSEVAQAFSHFTHSLSGGKMIVLDLQGVHVNCRRRAHLILTDPQVVSVNRDFGPADLGREGMLAFFKSHRCGPTCQRLGLVDAQTMRNTSLGAPADIKKMRHVPSLSKPPRAECNTVSENSSSSRDAKNMVGASDPMLILKSIQAQGIKPHEKYIRGAIDALESAGRTEESSQLQKEFDIAKIEHQLMSEKRKPLKVMRDGVCIQKHSGMGCAVLSFENECDVWVRNSLIQVCGERVRIQNTIVEIKPHRVGGVEQRNGMFLAWGRKSEKHASLSEEVVLNWFVEKIGDIKAGRGHCNSSALPTLPYIPPPPPPAPLAFAYPQQFPAGFGCGFAPPWLPSSFAQFACGKGPPVAMGNQPPHMNVHARAFAGMCFAQAAMLSPGSFPLANDARCAGDGGGKGCVSQQSAMREQRRGVSISHVSDGNHGGLLPQDTHRLSAAESGSAPSIWVHGPGNKKVRLPGKAGDDELAKLISSEFAIPPEEQHLLWERSPSDGTSENHVNVERKMSIAQLRFTHDSIRPQFRDGRKIFELLNDLNSGDVDPLRDLEPLDVVIHEGVRWSLSNRRLWALKCFFATSGQDVAVRVRVRPPDRDFREKLTTKNGGMSVQVTRSRSPSPSQDFRPQS